MSWIWIRQLNQIQDSVKSLNYFGFFSFAFVVICRFSSIFFYILVFSFNRKTIEERIHFMPITSGKTTMILIYIDKKKRKNEKTKEIYFLFFISLLEKLCCCICWSEVRAVENVVLEMNCSSTAGRVTKVAKKNKD